MTQNTTAPALHTVTISATYGWHAGRGVLATLRATDADVGFNRQEIEGTLEDFRAAVEAAKVERATATGSHKGALTRLIQRLEAPGALVALAAEREAKRAAKKAAREAARNA